MAKVNKIVNVNGKQFDLNGLPVNQSGSTSYLNVSFCECGWAGNTEWVYIALAPLNDEEQKISGKSTYLFHLSKHDNPLDAAYVAMEFAKNKEDNVVKLREVATSEWQCDIPKFEYEAIDSEDNKSRRQLKINKSKNNKKAIQSISATEALIAANCAYKDAGVKLTSAEMLIIRDSITGNIINYRVIEDVYAHTRDIIGSMR